MSVPASFRRVIEEGDPDWSPGSQPTFVLIYGLPGKPHLQGYTVKGVAELEAMVDRMPRFSKKRRAMEHILSTKSSDAQVDDNGRIILSAKLREIAGLNGEAVFAGANKNFEVWSPEAYAEHEAMLMETIDDLGGADALENIFEELEEDGGGL
ncbi:division/cell wall cluster transcriptional repressor MraZ [Amaricoccus macauensis]|uniref:division/cell wall cluster transcriptional repressor MraZ n=1 Tax=Amaricoccus macauensis TaxID=57001 RepID=UPI003C7B1C31